MLRVSVCSALFLNVSVAQVATLKSDAPRFEVAAVHPSDPGELSPSSGCPTTPGLMRCANVTLKRCIVGAYGVGPDRVLGGPDWINTERFQLTGRAEHPVGDKALMAMLQTLLAERFKLVLHREFRRGETMALEVARNGPKLQPASGGAYSCNNMHDHLDAATITMAEFAEILSRNLNLPVLDRTGLAGRFNFSLRWNPDNADVLERDEAAAVLRLEVAAALRRQLGLTLTFRKTPVEVLVIDHAERPAAEN